MEVHIIAQLISQLNFLAFPTLFRTSQGVQPRPNIIKYHLPLPRRYWNLLDDGSFPKAPQGPEGSEVGGFQEQVFDFIEIHPLAFIGGVDCVIVWSADIPE